MVTLKLQLYQNMVNYRKENSFGYIQSYPLPTPSMVRGMAHSLLDLKEYKPLKISIQGSFDSVCVNMQKIIKFDRNRPSNPYRVTIGTSKKTALNGILFVDSLVDCKIILHIAFDDEGLTKKLYEKARTNTVILGRNEDIARVDLERSKLVEIRQKDEIRLKYPIYLDKRTALKNQVVGTHYRLPFCYESVQNFNDLRIFKFVDCVYVSSETRLDNFYIDDDEDVVCFLEVS
ncbi:CRISPR-associated protein Cas5 [Desulfurella amilsii]|uniref:CRISPR-associated protein Cas5 n=1 Tax=Desulfurella amilsii TaxID=1562698 RepID=A0A1X4XVF7_9BACT|nr:CRISPR-associated protein Cas5 [Desulfurella amilsii]OSS41511.1 CRISPR-associated protein Cas5 [Desulfurella amilsii]